MIITVARLFFITCVKYITLVVVSLYGGRFNAFANKSNIGRQLERNFNRVAVVVCTRTVVCNRHMLFIGVVKWGVSMVVDVGIRLLTTT